MTDFSPLTTFAPDALPVTDMETMVDAAMSELDSMAFSSEGTIMSFDQSLANTGYVVLDYCLAVGVSVLEMNVIHTYTVNDNTSWTDTLQRPTQLVPPISALIGKYHPRIILHEMPPVGKGPFVHRSDSSIVTAAAIWILADMAEIPVQMVAANRMKKHITGNAKASKAEVRAALEARFDDKIRMPGFRRNEHTFDALGIAITYLEGAA
jgi:Holliday junction resolvasome RuvABC endonuclease subunit